MVFEYMFANLSLDAIELLLESCYFLDGLEIQSHLILPEALNFEKPHEQDQQSCEEGVDLDVFSDVLQLFCCFGLVGLEVASETGEDTLLSSIQFD